MPPAFSAVLWHNRRCMAGHSPRILGYLRGMACVRGRWAPPGRHGIRLSALVHVLTTWHPLHFAEDYALADVLADGRLLCGLGRGTEERESHVFGVNVGYSNNADDHHNRAVFEEQMAIFKAATANERFAYRGTYYTIPPEGLTFRGAPVTELPLVPRPRTTPVRVYQPLSSEATLCYAARQRHVGQAVGGCHHGERRPRPGEAREHGVAMALGSYESPCGIRPARRSESPRTTGDSQSHGLRSLWWGWRSTRH
jgi:hypothetical protein